jgi:polysaccharide export outer membrane protein
MDVEIARCHTDRTRRRTVRRSCTRLVLAAGVALGITVGLAGTPLLAQVTNYIVGPQDVLLITVFDQQDLGGKYTVDADGSVSFPLIGRLQAGGLSLQQVEAALRKALADGFFRNPQVSVTVEQYRSQRVFVVGEVRAPGTYQLSGDMTLIEALARAGSITQDAAGEAMIVRSQRAAADGPLLPDQDRTAEVVRVDIKELQSGRLSQNAMLRDGDTIFIPRAELIYVFGQVRNPGAYALQKGTTVLQALSLAGGVTDRGATGRIRIARVVGGKKTEIRTKTEDVVEPGDTIIVPERFF